MSKWIDFSFEGAPWPSNPSAAVAAIEQLLNK